MTRPLDTDDRDGSVPIATRSTPGAGSSPTPPPSPSPSPSIDASLGRLLGLAWPIVISRSSQVVVGVSDAVMVAGLGEAALAATTTGAMNAFTLFILPMGIVFIVSSFASQLAGAGDPAGARRYAFYGLGVALAAEVLALVTGHFIPPVLGWLGYEAAVRARMADYIAIRLLSSGAVVGMEALANYYGGVGNTRLPMLANLTAMVLNVFGNWLLIKGHWGLPALGVSGAAWASTIATTVAFAGLLACFLAGLGAPGGRIRSRLSWAEQRRLLRFGLPSGLNWFLEFLAYSFFVNVVVAGLGTTTLAALMAVMQLNSVAFMPAFAVSSAGAILVGQAIGARAHDEVPRLVRRTLVVAMIWEGLAGVAYLTLPQLLLRPFADEATVGRAAALDRSGLLAIGARMLMLSAAWQLFDAAVSTYAEALRAAGDTAFTLWARVVIAWAVFVPGVLVTVRWLGGGDVGALLWLVAYMALLAAVLVLRFRGGAWRRLDLTGHAGGEGPPI